MALSKLDDERPPRKPKLVGFKPPTTRDKLDSVFRMSVGLIPLAIGAYSLVITIAR
jgi:hypothetical protein